MKNSPVPIMRGVLLFACCALVSSIFCLPMRVAAAPITLTMDNPNQVTSAPSSGTTVVSFSGTVVVDPAWVMQGAFVDAVYNAAKTISLGGAFSPAFQTFVLTMQTGTFTGVFFTLNVPAGTPNDLYGFQFTSGLSMFKVQVANNSTMTTSSAMQSVSVLVTPRLPSVPEGGSTALLLGLALGAFALQRGVFAREARRQH